VFIIITHKWLFVNISDYLSIFQKLARMVNPLHYIGFAIAKTLQNAICISARSSDYEISLSQPIVKKIIRRGSYDRTASPYGAIKSSRERD